MADVGQVNFALERLAHRRHKYHVYHEYYEGDQPMGLASDAFRSAFGGLLRQVTYNRCAPVVDAISDRLQITGWTSERGDGPTADMADMLWRNARGDWLQGLLHVEALRSGDAYLIVWPDPVSGLPKWTVNRADLCSVVTDEETGATTCGTKLWRVRHGADAGRWRLTVYEPDVVTRWITKGKQDDQPVDWAKFVAYEADGAPEGANPFGIVPLIHFANNAQFPGDFGMSELRDVLPLQDALNKSMADHLVASEFVAYPQRWAVGIEPQVDPQTGLELETFRPGVDRMFLVADAQAKFGEFSAADMTQFLEVTDAWDMRISRVSRVPVHWLGMATEFPSGEALKTAESPFVAKLRDRQIAFTDAWARSMALALRIAGVAGEQADAIAPEWMSAETRSEREAWDLALMKKATGVPNAQLWAENGYTEEQVVQFEEAAQVAQDQQAFRLGAAFNAGGGL